VRVVRLPGPRIAQVAAERTGIVPAEFRFDAMTPRSAALARYWRDTISYLHQSLNCAGSAAVDPLANAALLVMAATAAIATFPNTATAATPVRGPGRVAPAAVRRAVAFIDAHADQPITVTEIAEASGLGARRR
jgi:hypothetical protein